MEAGDVNEFVDNLEIQDEMVRYQGRLLYFYGVQHDMEKQNYFTHIDMFETNFDKFIKEVCYIEADTASDCMRQLLEGKWFEGKSFWEVESKMTWVDG